MMSDGTATPKSKLDSLSREDLIKFVKKQVANLKSYKDQCSEQTEKIARLEKGNEFLRTENEKLQKSIVQVNYAQCQTEVEENLKIDSFANEHQLRQQIMVLRTALNRRRFEIEDLRENLNQQPILRLTDDYSSQTAMEKGNGSSFNLGVEVSVQTDNDIVDKLENLKRENSRLICQLQDLNQKEIDNSSLKNLSVEVSAQTHKEIFDQLENLKRENSNLNRQLQELNQKTVENADDSLLNLEIEDYQRTVQKLQTDLTSKSVELLSKISENQTFFDELKILRKSFSDLQRNSDDSCTKLKFLEIELANAEIIVKEKSQEALAALEKCRNFELQLNESKLELSGVWSQHQQTSAQLEDSVANLKNRLTNSEDECTKTKETLKEISAEFETYKVRAHSAFKQKRGEPEENVCTRDEKAVLEKSILSLQDQLVKANALYQSTLENLHRCQEQYDQTVSKYKSRESMFEQTVVLLRKQVADLRTESAAQKDELIRDATLKQTQLKSDFEKQVRIMVEKNAEKLSELRINVYQLEESLREARSTRPKDPSSAGYSDNEDRPPPIDERKPAEGSENVDLKLAPLSVDINRLNSPLFSEFPHLDDVLNFDHESDTGTVSVVDYSAIETKMEDALKRNRHLAEVLAESEANSTRLNEQIRLLKDEIRRLERNQEREKHIANAEYLKNVIMKFVNPNAKEQKASLVPVMATLLRLSAEEIKILEDLSSDGGGPNPTSPGWSGYLHRWSGIN